MPPKRKALVETTGNKNDAPKPRNAKAQKTSLRRAAPTSKGKPKAKMYKYCSANSLPKDLPKYINLQWPNFSDFIDDKDQDIPANGALMEGWIDRVSDLGFPVSEEGMKILDKLEKEVEKRDQDLRAMFIWNDWTGWGIAEVMENLLKDFDKLLFRKSVSPWKKWALIEGLACTLLGDEDTVTRWIMNDDGEGTKEIVEMIGNMVLTSFAILAEHDLLTSNSQIKNISTVSLIFIQFLDGQAIDLDCKWACEVVRLCDEAGINLEASVHKQLTVTKERLRDLRETYMAKKQSSEFDMDSEEGVGNGYAAFARKENWTPDDDIEEEDNTYNVGPSFDPMRMKMWYRWDWALEYKEFKKKHKGGTKYDLTKWNKKEREAYTFGTKAHDRRMQMEMTGEYRSDE